MEPLTELEPTEDGDSVSGLCSGTDTDVGPAPSILPLDVMNNYFSLGADAHVSLEFHESRGKQNHPGVSKIIQGSISGIDHQHPGIGRQNVKSCDHPKITIYDNYDE